MHNMQNIGTVSLIFGSFGTNGAVSTVTLPTPKLYKCTVPYGAKKVSSENRVFLRLNWSFEFSV